MIKKNLVRSTIMLYPIFFVIDKLRAKKIGYNSIVRFMGYLEMISKSKSI